MEDASGRPHLVLGIQVIAIDVVREVRKEAPRTLPRVLVCLGAAGTTLAAGAMAWFGVTLNYFNMALIAVTAGMAVDGAIHLVWMARSPGWTIDDLAAISRANVGALLTTATGFGALWLTDHPGVASMGAAAWMAARGLDRARRPVVALALAHDPGEGRGPTSTGCVYKER